MRHGASVRWFWNGPPSTSRNYLVLGTVADSARCRNLSRHCCKPSFSHEATAVSIRLVCPFSGVLAIGVAPGGASALSLVGTVAFPARLDRDRSFARLHQSASI